ncbi:hypothetical protein FRC00_013641, partial [Tulasnella sp. 408]
MFDKLSLVLSASRNRLVPINRLPQDIMYRILSIVLQLENIHGIQLSVGLDYTLKFIDQRGRLRLVSRIWNSFVVSTPGFWSLVDIRAPSQELLSWKIKLAQQAELCITHQSPYFSHSDYQQLATFLPAYLDRIRTLRLGSQGFAAAFFQNSFPGLCTLEMWNHRWFTLAQDRFPQLRNLRLSSCSIPQDALPLNSLRILHLYDTWNPDLSAIIGFLKICPEIEELTISQSDDESMWIRSPSTTVRLEKLRRLELRNLDLPCVLHFFGFAKIPNLKQAIFTVPAGTAADVQNALREILGTLQISSSGSGPMELSVLSDAVTCAMQDSRLVKVHLPQTEACADTFLDCLKPGTLRIAVELEDQNRLRWLKRVLERTNVIELQVRLGCDALQFGRAVTDYLAHFGEEQTEEKSESELPLPLPSLQALAFEDGTVDIPHLLRMVASRINGRQVASAQIQSITL